MIFKLSFFISIKYFFDIDSIKKDEIKIKHFINFEKLSTLILFLNILIDSRFPVRMINRIEKIIIMESS